MKEKYIDLMEKALSAYSDEHILRYFDQVKEEGLTEHGFPRLTSNIGILIAFGRRRDLLPIFLEMMDFCCASIPNRLAANDFSVREIISCLCEVERAGVVPEERTKKWRADLATIDPTKTYNRFVTTVDIYYRNWVLFTALSEFFRLKAGIGGSEEFLELQFLQQMQWFDENGMYGDDHHTQNHQPIQYDLVPRGLCCVLLNEGYRGKSYEVIDENLKKAGLHTLAMQSTIGEMAFGGRSNQFLLNEGWLICVLEFEAKRYAREGNAALAAKFKAASARALSLTEQWLNRAPIRHVKNRFPLETKYGCEGYGYFDKYMITVASLLYSAYTVCDDSIPFEPTTDRDSSVMRTTDGFHKLFLKCGGYALEFDTDADPHYDANGLGRVHRSGAPSAICLSCPCPATPNYTVDVETPFAFSLCSAVKQDGGWLFGANEDSAYEILTTSKTESEVSAELLCRFANGQAVKEAYSVREDGVAVTLSGEGTVGYALPAFCFDGTDSPEISVDEQSLTVSYEGKVCRYTTNGKILNLGKVAANRNGHYRTFLAQGEDNLWVKIEIV
ncbi:MAG: hypothetical protein IKA76_01965 [Clostridia bacterium]|nr:hypothetical protein [Clostridia bacterium]